MKITQLFLCAAVTLSIAACKSKKTSTSTATAPATPAAGTSGVLIKSSNGVYAPGPEELKAVQPMDKDISIEKLNLGYTLYAESACVSCHGAKNIYRIDPNEWRDICNNMSQKAKISEAQKDAVYKYVLAIQAVKASGK